MIVINFGTARQFMEKLTNIKFREYPFNGSLIFMGVQTDARTVISVGDVQECKYTQKMGRG